MRRLCVCAAAGLALGLLARQACARDIYVALTGLDTAAGTTDAPYRTITYAMQQAAYGDTIRVRAGRYNESFLEVPSGVTVVSEDGLHAARVYGGAGTAFRFENGCTDAEVRGFEVWTGWNGGLYTLDSLVRAYDCSNIRIRDLLVHEAPADGDVIKIGGAGFTTTDILVENCIVYNPAPRNGDPWGGSGWQECIDIYPATGVTIRNCWIFHTSQGYHSGDTLIYAKGGSRNILWENNVFGPRVGRYDGNCSTSAGGPSPAVYPSCQDFIARNNLFLDCSGDAAFGLLSAVNVEFYNNIIWNYTGPRAAIEFWTVGAGTNQNFRFHNNIIYNSNGKGVFSDRGFMPSIFYHDYNLYYQVPGGGSVDISAETHSLFGVDPMLAAPAGPAVGWGPQDSWAGIVNRFRLLEGSPAIDRGLDLAALVATDVRDVPRPLRAGWDIGPYEVPRIGDIDFDGLVDVSDLLAMVDAFGSIPGQPNYDPAADLNGDGAVDVIDLLELVARFGT